MDGWKVSQNKCVLGACWERKQSPDGGGECQGGGMEGNQFDPGGKETHNKRREKGQPPGWDGRKGQAETAGTVELCQHSAVSQID